MKQNNSYNKIQSSTGLHRSSRNRTFLSLSEYFTYERYEPLHSPNYELNKSITVLQVWIWHDITHEGCFAIKTKKPNELIAQSAGVVEYTDCFSAEG